MKPYWKSEDGCYQIFLGNCLDVLSKMKSKTVHMVFTDPPYGHNNNNNDLIHRREVALGSSKEQQESRPIKHDGYTANPIFRLSLSKIENILIPGGCCCCSGGGPDPQFARWSLYLDEIFNFKQMIVWDKGPIGMGWHYRRSYETVLVAEKKGGKSMWYDTSHKVENIIRPSYGIKKIIPQKNDHPTAKPWQLSAHFIRLHTKENDIVVDPFMGGGSTGEACVRLDRRFIGIELDKTFCDMSVERLERTISEKGN